MYFNTIYYYTLLLLLKYMIFNTLQFKFLLSILMSNRYPYKITAISLPIRIFNAIPSLPLQIFNKPLIHFHHTI